MILEAIDTDDTLDTHFTPRLSSEKSVIIEGDIKPVSDVSSVSISKLKDAVDEINSRKCEDCGKWKLPSCGAIGDPRQITAEHWAGACRSFLKKQDEMSNPGADM